MPSKRTRGSRLLEQALEQSLVGPAVAAASRMEGEASRSSRYAEVPSDMLLTAADHQSPPGWTGLIRRVPFRTEVSLIERFASEGLGCEFARASTAHLSSAFLRPSVLGYPWRRVAARRCQAAPTRVGWSRTRCPAGTNRGLSRLASSLLTCGHAEPYRCTATHHGRGVGSDARLPRRHRMQFFGSGRSRRRRRSWIAGELRDAPSGRHALHQPHLALRGRGNLGLCPGVDLRGRALEGIPGLLRRHEQRRDRQ